MSRHRGLVAVLLAVGALVLAARTTEIYRVLEDKTLDWRFRHFSDSKRHDPRIVLVMLDQASLDHFEKESLYWPWPRSMYGAALKFLKKGGARLAVFDVLFTSPSPYGAAEDQSFAKALADFGRERVVMAMESGRGGRAPHWPVPEIKAASGWLGDTAAEPDPDGVFRRVPVSSPQRAQPSLPEAAALAFAGKDLAGLGVPTAGGAMLVRFHGKALTSDPRIKTYEAYSLGDLLLSWQAIEDGRRPTLDPARFKDKAVFIGMSAAGLLDNRPSPISPVFPGTEVVAAAFDNMVNRDFLLPVPAAATFALILAALLLAGVAARRGTARQALAFLALGAVAFAGLAAAAFRHGRWLELAAPELALGLGFAAASAWSYAVEGRQKRYIQAAFSHYLSPEVVTRIAESPRALALGGERREATFYFSDIEGFTTISETMDPERLTALMNRYLGEMTETILASGGTLDKYIGDAIMAFWGAPLPCAEHALIACKVALENQAKLAALREALQKEGYPPVRNRIGLNSGPASIGNMGSSRRFSYTAIGDNVNLASRLEGANKAYGSYILISESTRDAAGGAIEVRELDFVKVKGKNKPIKVYELLGMKGATAEPLLKKARRFEEGLSLYRARRFAEAQDAFRSALRDFGPDHACEKYLERCGASAASLPADWDGSFALTEK